MAGSNTSTDRLAIYLETGWSDYLLDPSSVTATSQDLPYPNPLASFVSPDFHYRIATLTREWAGSQAANIKSYCDIGGATGRALFEIDRNFTGLERLTLVEPSRTFCGWAERLLTSSDELPEFPALMGPAGPRLVKAFSRPAPLPEAEARVRIVNQTLERFQTDEKFDLVTCLNMIDRHPYPRTLISSLANILADGGLLVISSPFDFRVATTPDRADWIDDLKELFRSPGWQTVGEEQVYYEFRSSNRKWTRFIAQVVGARWQP